MKKLVVASTPHYNKEGGLLHEYSAFCSWKKMGGRIISSRYPIRLFHGILYRFMFPHLPHNQKEARLKFMAGGSSFFRAYPDYLRYEIIPLYWDCWPIYQHKIEKFLEGANVKTAIFTSSQVAERMRDKYPYMNILSITEGIDVGLYNEGKALKERDIDVIEFGRQSKYLQNCMFPNGISYVHSTNGKRLFASNSDFFSALSNSKITIALPRSITHPEIAGDIETLTQRYWENMLSRIVMVGKAPKELVEYIGYNPVIDIDEVNVQGQIENILENISKYQILVDKNRQVALKRASWDIRMIKIRNFLTDCGYIV